MLQVQFIRENKIQAIEALAKRNFNARDIIAQVISTDEERRKIQAELDNILAESNKLSKEIGSLFKNGEHAKANELKAKTGNLKELSKELDRKSTRLTS